MDVTAAGVGFVDGLMVQGLYQVKPPLPYYPGSEFAVWWPPLVLTFRPLPPVIASWVSRTVAPLPTKSPWPPTSWSSYLKTSARPSPPDFLLTTPLPCTVERLRTITPRRNHPHPWCRRRRRQFRDLRRQGHGGDGHSRRLQPGKRQAALSFGADHLRGLHRRKLAGTTQRHRWQPRPKSRLRSRWRQQVRTSFRSLSPGGRFLVVGFAAGEIPKIPLNLPLLKRSAIVGVDWGGEMRANPAINDELMSTLMQWIEAGKMSPAAVQSRPMNDYQQALTDQLAGNILGKLVLTN